jgi:hypothetical protein
MALRSGCLRFDALDQLHQFVKFFLEEVEGDLVEFDVIGNFAFKLFGSVDDEVIGFGENFGSGVVVVGHDGFLGEMG